MTRNGGPGRVGRRDDRGLVLPSWLVAVCAVVVVLAVLGFAVSGDQDPEVTAATDPASGPATTPDSRAGGGGQADDGANSGGEQEGADRPGPVERRTAYVEVYNNSGITGLAGQTAATLQDTGWRVVVTDNWYGEIPTDTVYFPADLAGQADLLAGDTGIERVRPAVGSMSFDRLTVILTG